MKKIGLVLMFLLLTGCSTLKPISTNSCGIEYPTVTDNYVCSKLTGNHLARDMRPSMPDHTCITCHAVDNGMWKRPFNGLRGLLPNELEVAKLVRKNMALPDDCIRDCLDIQKIKDVSKRNEIVKERREQVLRNN
jgi:hypothetical protein